MTTSLEDPRSSGRATPVLGNRAPTTWADRLVGHATLLLFGLLLIGVGIIQPRFLVPSNLLGIVVESTATATVAIGMTFVLVTAGVDLSVGAAMFVGAGIAGRLALAGHSPWVALPAMIGIGLVFGGVNALLVTRLRILPFIATLALLNIGRGAGLGITETRAMNLPDAFASLGSARWLGIPASIWFLALIVGLAHTVLTRTPFGRQLHAVGHDADAARKAGLPVARLTASAYLICGACAGLGGIAALVQLGAVSPRFGEGYEFEAITAAVIGGTSLFGGRGRVFPGAILGAILVEALFNGLVMLEADPYLFPSITGATIFLAVLVDSLRTRAQRARSRRRIYLDSDLDPDRATDRTSGVPP